MMERVVLDPDGHRWTLRSQMEWRQPDDVDDFEHDVSASSTSAFVLFGLIIVLAVVLVVAIPEDVVAPWSGRMLWLGFAAWTLVALAVILLDRDAWRLPPRDAVSPPAGRPAGPVLTTSVVQS